MEERIAAMHPLQDAFGFIHKKDSVYSWWRACCLLLRTVKIYCFESDLNALITSFCLFFILNYDKKKTAMVFNEYEIYIIVEAVDAIITTNEQLVFTL